MEDRYRTWKIKNMLLSVIFFWVDLEKEEPIFSIVYPKLTPSPMDSTNPMAIQIILIKLNMSRNKPKVMNLGKRHVERREDK